MKVDLTADASFRTSNSFVITNSMEPSSHSMVISLDNAAGGEMEVHTLVVTSVAGQL